jgi:hypothetical protein
MRRLIVTIREWWFGCADRERASCKKASQRQTYDNPMTAVHLPLLPATRFVRSAFNVYRLRLDSGQTVHAFKAHTEILPASALVTACVNAEHPPAVFDL